MVGEDLARVDDAFLRSRRLPQGRTAGGSPGVSSMGSPRCSPGVTAGISSCGHHFLRPTATRHAVTSCHEGATTIGDLDQRERRIRGTERKKSGRKRKSPGPPIWKRGKGKIEVGREAPGRIFFPSYCAVVKRSFSANPQSHAGLASSRSTRDPFRAVISERSPPWSLAGLDRDRHYDFREAILPRRGRVRNTCDDHRVLATALADIDKAR